MPERKPIDPNRVSRLALPRAEAKEDAMRAWHVAQEARREREEQALEDYLLYMRKEPEPTQAQLERNDYDDARGSRLRSPLVYWAVETLVPRLVSQPPTVTASALSPAAIPYALAKQYRLQYYLRTGSWHPRLIRSARQMLVLGDSPAKVPYLPQRKRPEMVYLSWWDFFISPEAESYDVAEDIFHRTFYTRRQLSQLAQLRDSRDRPLYADLDKITPSTRDTADPTFVRRREASGDFDGEMFDQELYQVIEVWGRDGSLVTLGGKEGDVLLSMRPSPYKNEKGERFRPFVMFSFSPDIAGPYSNSLPQLIGHHQIELETLRNAQMDQISYNLHAPIIHSDAIRAEDVDEAYSRPGGRLEVSATRFPNVRDALFRDRPGEASADYERAREDVRQEVAMVTGINDVVSGVQTPGGISNETATGAQILATEGNKRVQILGIGMELEMTKVARMIDAHDRQYGGELVIPIPPNVEIPDPTPGIVRNGPVVRSLPHVNTRDKEYVVEVDAGSLTSPDQMEESRKLQNFVAMVSHPAIAQHVDWAAVTRQIAYSLGLGESVILTPQEQIQQMLTQQAMAAQAFGPPGGPSSQPGQAQGPQGATRPPTPAGPPAPPNVAGPQER